MINFVLILLYTFNIKDLFFFILYFTNLLFFKTEPKRKDWKAEVYFLIYYVGLLDFF